MRLTLQLLLLVHQGLFAFQLVKGVTLLARVELLSSWFYVSYTSSLILLLSLLYYYDSVWLFGPMSLGFMLFFLFKHDEVQGRGHIQGTRLSLALFYTLILERGSILLLTYVLPNSITGSPMRYIGLVILLDVVKLTMLYVKQAAWCQLMDRLVERLMLNARWYRTTVCLGLVVVASVSFAPIRYAVILVRQLPLDSILFYQLLMIWITTIILLHSLILWLKRRQEKRQQTEQLRQYTENIEQLYNQLALFRHDYLNILYSLRLSIDDKDMASVERIFYETVAPTQKIIQSDAFELGKLSQIEWVEVKSVLYSKLVEAQAEGVRVVVNVGNMRWNESVNRTIFVRVLSILLDNAIQAAKQAEDPYMVVTLHSHHAYGLITIKNSYLTTGTLFEQPTSPATRQLQKVNAANHGHGLYYVRQAVSEQEHLDLLTEVSPEEVSQQLIIRLG